MCRALLPLLASLMLLQLADYTDTQAEKHWEKNYKSTQEVQWENYKHGRHSDSIKPRPFCSWKCLLFTIQWPGAFCQSLNNGTLCRIPPNVNNWTIHGLWPERARNCCNCWPMFQSDVEELESELTEHWPSLLTVKSSFSFWREEWEKHGACAACVEGMNSPFRYFQICLKLRQRFDIHKLLEDAGITPSCERPYKLSEVLQTLVPQFGDKLEIQCVADDQDREVWFQVKIPLSHNLTLGCDHHGATEGDTEARSSPKRSPSAGHPCPDDAPFYYLPIDHQKPQRPCN